MKGMDLDDLIHRPETLFRIIAEGWKALAPLSRRYKYAAIQSSIPGDAYIYMYIWVLSVLFLSVRRYRTEEIHCRGDPPSVVSLLCRNYWESKARDKLKRAPLMRVKVSRTADRWLEVNFMKRWRNSLY